MKKCLLMMSLAVAGATVQGVDSEPATVIASQSSIYWTTLTSRQPALTCLWPENARRATLRVSGAQTVGEQTFERVGGEALLQIDSLRLEIPATFETEGLCTFTLAFDSGEVLSRSLASVRGVDGVGTRVVVTDDFTSREWQFVKRNALIPIVDEGVETVRLNDAEVPANLNGACGWFEWRKLPPGTNRFAANDREATFIAIWGGIMIRFK